MDSFVLPNGIRIIHQPVASDVAYCGLMVNTGSRDEAESEFGMAHFIEHAMFKGTKKRSPRQIIDRMENIGGELNAYTTKEETAVYCAMLTPYFERGMELMADMLFDSVFPQAELGKELTVVLEEIDTYNDSPSELIYDDFEAVIYDGHALGHPILGFAETIGTFNTAALQHFVATKYNTDEMVFFSQGNIPFEKIIRWSEKYLACVPAKHRTFRRSVPAVIPARKAVFSKDTHQTHFMCGSRAYDLHHPKRLGMYLLNNILGGPGMNSLLNLSLRERLGLVYTVESTYTPLSDTGFWTVYFGCDTAQQDRCERLVYNELRRLCDKLLSEVALRKYKQQLRGQMAIAAENRESNVLGMAKSFLHLGYAATWQETYKQVEQISAMELQEIANEVFDEKNISVLTYE